MEEEKTIYCWGREITEQIIYYLKQLDITVVPKSAKHRSLNIYTPIFVSEKETTEATSMDDSTITVDFPHSRRKLLIKDNTVEVMGDDYRHWISYYITKGTDDGFRSWVIENKKNDEYSIFVTVTIDELNGVDISVGRTSGRNDFGIHIPVGKKRYQDATYYLTGIITNIIDKGIYNSKELKLLKLALGDPSLKAKLDDCIKKIPKDIASSFDKRETELRTEADKKISEINKELSNDIQSLTLLRERAYGYLKESPSDDYVVCIDIQSDTKKRKK